MEALPTAPPALWRNRNYLMLWGGQVISNAGSGVSQIAYPLLVLAITRSPAQAGFVAAVRTLAYVVFVLPAGALVDRWNRKRLMIVCDTGRAVCLASIAAALLVGHVALVQLYVTGFLEVMFGVFFDLAELAATPQVVRREHLHAATSRIQVTAGLTNLIGPALGGFLYALRALLPFAADALSYLVSVASLGLITVPFQLERAAAKRNLRREISEGLHWVWHHPVIRTTALLSGGNNFLGAGYTLIVIVIAQQQRTSAASIGLIFAIGGAGGILGALCAVQMYQQLGFARTLTWTLWLYVVFWLPLAALPNPWLLGVLTAALYFIGPMFSVTTVSYRLAHTPDDRQGRVNSAARLIALGAAPLGVAVTGLLLQHVGPQLTVWLSVAGQGVLALAASADRHIRTVAWEPARKVSAD